MELRDAAREIFPKMVEVLERHPLLVTSASLLVTGTLLVVTRRI